MLQFDRIPLFEYLNKLIQIGLKMVGLGRVRNNRVRNDRVRYDRVRNNRDRNGSKPYRIRFACCF